jgi:hypothetical protein
MGDRWRENRHSPIWILQRHKEIKKKIKLANPKDEMDHSKIHIYIKQKKN